MSLRPLGGTAKREPTWADRDYVARLREDGVEDVYVDIDDADQSFWESVVMATHEYLIKDDLHARGWDDWLKQFRWALSLPVETGYPHRVYVRVVRDGVYPLNNRYVNSMSSGQRLAAVEHLLDVVAFADIEGFRTAINEKAAWLRVGVRVEGKRFVSVTSELMHRTVVQPALLLLSHSQYREVDALYRKGFERMFSKDHAGAITVASSSVEEMLRLGLGEKKGELQPLLDKAKKAGWIIPAVEQMAVKLAALRNESDAHKVGTDRPEVAMFALHVAGALLVHLGAVMPDGS